MRLKTKNQEMALYAFKCIQEIKDKGDKELENKYKSKARSLPSMITHNGLLTTLTFLYAKAQGKNDKKDTAEKYLLIHIIVWLKKLENKDLDDEDIKCFLRHIAKEDFRRLLIISKEALSISQWIKRIAEGELEGNE